MEIKHCKICGEEKPLSEFYKMKGGRYGRGARCKTCMLTGTCQDCGRPIGAKATRCKSCASKVRWASGIFDNEKFRRKQAEGISRGVRAAWARGAYCTPRSAENECQNT